jgi:hypothetical protein
MYNYVLLQATEARVAHAHEYDYVTHATYVQRPCRPGHRTCTDARRLRWVSDGTAAAELRNEPLSLCCSLCRQRG